MNKKGFTLTELIGVIIILAAIGLLVFPIVTKILNDNKEKLYKEQIDSLISVARNWNNDNYELVNENGDYFLQISELVEKGYIKNSSIINPKTDKPIIGCIEIYWKEDIKQYKYNYTEDCVAEKPTIMAAGTVSDDNNMFLGGPIARKDIKSITFVKHKNVPEGYTSWDVSQAKDGSIFAWYDPNETTPYDIIIGNKRGVEGNPDSRYLFSYLTNLTNIDLTNFSTNNVTNMQSMFYGLTNLTTLDFRNATFDAVTSSDSMFVSVPTSATIYVKDNAAKTFIESKFTGTNIIIP